MAILENETQNYIKIHFEECMIKGYSVYVTCSVYKTQNDREKEKIRAPLIVDFLNKIEIEINRLYQNLLSEIAKTGKEPSEIVDENGHILSEYENLILVQKEMESLNGYPQYLSRNFYLYNGEKESEILTVDYEKLSKFGLKKEWLDDPIQFLNKCEIYCGEYEGETINHEFYYNKLKMRLNDNIEDC